MSDVPQGAIPALAADVFALVNRVKTVNQQLRAAGDALSHPLSEPEPEIVLTESQAATQIRYGMEKLKEAVARLETHATRLHPAV